MLGGGLRAVQGNGECRWGRVGGGGAAGNTPFVTVWSGRGWAGLGGLEERSCTAKMEVWLAGRVGRWLARLGGRCAPALSSQLPPGGVEPQHSGGLGVGRWPVPLGSPAEFAGAAARSGGGQRVGGWVLPCFSGAFQPLGGRGALPHPVEGAGLPHSSPESPHFGESLPRPGQ